MNPVRFLWTAYWHFSTRARAVCFRLLGGSFFGGVGRGTRFFGWPGFGTCQGNIFLGKRCLIGRQVFFSAAKEAKITVGDDCSLNTGCHLVAIYEITIGEGTRIGEYCSIRDQNHEFSDATTSVSGQGYTGSAIRIGRNCWIGRGVFIGPGVTIGDGAVVGANAVVVKDVEANAIVGGVPAKVIGRRDDSNRSADR